MKNIKRALGIALFGVLGAAIPSAHASFDYQGCQWWDECPLSGMPYLDVNNDTRVNLMQLVGSQKGLFLPRLPQQEMSSDSRRYHFGVIEYDFKNHQTSTKTPSPGSASPLTSLDKLAASLGVSPSFAHNSDVSAAEGRHVSNNPHSVEAFFVALLEDETVTPVDRQRLAAWRVEIYGSGDRMVTPQTFEVEPGSNTEAFCHYLNGANAFYRGDYDAADEHFTSALVSSQPWVKETASYMLFRVTLNKSTAKASDSYGFFDVDNVDKMAAAKARELANAYLSTYPEGRYADSARGMQRRVNWYLSDWSQLAEQYEKALEQAQDIESLHSVISENDSILQSKDAAGDVEPFISDEHAPLLTFTQTLRGLREYESRNNTPLAVTKERLDSLKPMFAAANKMPLWDYLHNSWLFTQERNFSAVVSAIQPAKSLPANDILLFSQQILLGEALAVQQLWPQEEAHWRHLLTLAQLPEQQQYLQLKLAANLVNSQKEETIFADDSLVTNLRYRSLVLKTIAKKPLLQQQVINGKNDLERTIALHTLLMRDLMFADYEGYQQDKLLSSNILAPVIGDEFADVNLSAFDWQGKNTEEGYYCASLTETVQALAKNKSDAHALNCLSEFFRITDISINISTEIGGTEALYTAASAVEMDGKPDRLANYTQVINDPKAEPEDKTYALYRAVNCYAPSGYNHCGGPGVEQKVRKRWFTQLKTEYKGNKWANGLDYYW